MDWRSGFIEVVMGEEFKEFLEGRQIGDDCAWLFGFRLKVRLHPQLPDGVAFIFKETQDVVAFWIHSFQQGPHLIAMLETNGLFLVSCCWPG